MIDTFYYVFYTLQDFQIFTLGSDGPQVNNNTYISVRCIHVSFLCWVCVSSVSSDQWS